MTACCQVKRKGKHGLSLWSLLSGLVRLRCGALSLCTFVAQHKITYMTNDQSLRHEGEHLLDEIKSLGHELLNESNEPALLPSIYTRRSIRKFVDTPLTGDEVQILLEAGLRAPSSKNKHTTQFVLVEDRPTLDRLSGMRPSGALFLQQVPLGIVVLGSPMECERWIADASLAAGYIQLQAEALGLGSCWADAYGCYTEAGQESAEYVRNVLDIPYQLEVLCILAIGHKAGEAAPRPTETLKWEKIHIGRYQAPEVAQEEA